MPGAPRRNGAKRSGAEEPLANITTAEWGVTFGSNGKILEMRAHSFGFNVIVSECLQASVYPLSTYWKVN